VFFAYVIIESAGVCHVLGCSAAPVSPAALQPGSSSKALETVKD
jgi:hypothetical protein